MSYTVLRVVDRGVVLFDAHRARLEAAGAGHAFDRWAASAAPGVYVLRAFGGELAVEPRDGSRFVEGMPVRTRVSPFAREPGPFPKPAPPSLYDGVRVAGVATLLTDAIGEAVLEACSASVLAWDGAELVGVPEASPRVAAAAERCVLDALAHRRARVLVRSDWPLLLVNAVAGAVGVRADGRGAFPKDVRARVEEALAGTARR